MPPRRLTRRFSRWPNAEETTPTASDPASQDEKGFPAPSEGFIVTHLLIVADQDRSREFYQNVGDMRRWRGVFGALLAGMGSAR